MIKISVTKIPALDAACESYILYYLDETKNLYIKPSSLDRVFLNNMKYLTDSFTIIDEKLENLTKYYCGDTIYIKVSDILSEDVLNYSRSYISTFNKGNEADENEDFYIFSYAILAELMYMYTSY